MQLRRIDASATAYNALRPIRVPLFEILLSSPLNLPDSLTELSMPKKATRCFGLIKPSISPISAIKVIAVNRPIPGIESINSILFLIDSGKSSDSITVLICSNKMIISDSIVFINVIELDIFTAKPSNGKPITLASFAALINFEYIFSDHAIPFLELLRKILMVSSLGASKIDLGIGY